MAEQNVDYSMVKKPGNDSPLTAEQVDDFMKCRNDPWYFFTNKCYVDGGRLFEPRDYQIDLLEDIIDNRFVIVNAPR